MIARTLLLVLLPLLVFSAVGLFQLGFAAALVTAVFLALRRQETQDEENSLRERVEWLELTVGRLQRQLKELQQSQRHSGFAAPPPTADFRQPENPLPEQTPAAAPHPLQTPPPVRPEVPADAAPAAAFQAAPTEAEIKTDAGTAQNTFRQPESPVRPTPSGTAPVRGGNGKIIVRRRKAAADTAEDADAPNPTLAWFLKGNPLLKAGVVVLFLGLAFLLRFASEHIHLPVRVRYLAVAAAGLAAALTGWKLQRQRREYGLVLQGFGIAVMYLTALAAVKLHPLLPADAALVLMVALVLAMAMLALLQDAEILALVALAGGMAAPLLLADGSGSHVFLFSYLALLNAGVALMAWFKSWRSLNLAGFCGSFLIAVSWGMHDYRPQLFASAEAFLLYHWLLYTLIACLFARRVLLDQENALQNDDDDGTPPDDATLAQLWQALLRGLWRVGMLDSALLFGSAFAAFQLQYAMLAAGAPLKPAAAALLFAAVYALFALVLGRGSRAFAVLAQAFAALAALFATLAVPLAFGRAQTVSLWALEAALAYFFARKQRLAHVRLAALLLYLATALNALGTFFAADNASTAVALATAAGGGMLVCGAFYGFRLPAARWERNLQTAAMAAVVLLLPLLARELFAPRGFMLTVALLALAAAWLHRRFDAKMLPAAAVFYGGLVLVEALAGTAPSESVGQPSWPALLWQTSSSLLPPVFAAAALAAASYMLFASADEGQSENHNRHRSGREITHSKQPENLCAALLLACALPTAFAAIARFGDAWGKPDTALLLQMLPFLLLAAVGRRLDWRHARQAALVLLPLLGAVLWPRVPDWAQHGLLPGLIVLSAFSAAAVWITTPQRFYRRENGLLWHGLMLAVPLALWTRFSGLTAAEHLPAAWQPAGWLAAPFAGALLLYALRRHTPPRYDTLYRPAAGAALASFALLWLLWANWRQPAESASYLPLLNLLELPQLALFAFAWQSRDHWLETTESGRRPVYAVFAAAALYALSAAVMRLWHFYGGVVWQLDTLLASFGLQASLSIVWALAAIALMTSGHRRGIRPLWFCGAALMAVVVAKLFLVELGNSGGIARIVSFIVVGLLLLLVGWFAPVPPKDET